VAVKSGRSKAGAKAASSHTGALAASDAVVDALFRQSGVIRTTTLEQLFDVASLLSQQPLPAGRRVAIVTNAGGPGILAADACEGHRLELPALSEATRAELRAFLPSAASVHNPVDMLASAPAEHYRRAVASVMRDPSVDAGIVIFIPPLVTETDTVAAAISEAAAGCPDKPLVAVMMRAGGAPSTLTSIPWYQFPESAAIALARAAAYAEWRRKPEGEVPVFRDIRMETARGPVEAALQRGGGWLAPEETRALLAAIGIPHVAARSAVTVAEAVAAAEAIGFPVTLKASGPALLHKTEHGAVVLDLRSTEAVRAAAAQLIARLGDAISGFEVQQMVRGGVEMIVGAVNDPLFGPVVVCGSGGVLAELVADSASRLHPLTGADANEMIDELRSARLLRGYRGQAAVDEPALKEAILRVSALLTLCPEVQELDINPLTVLETGVCALDARVRVEREGPPIATRRVVY
jgi:acyl-CoA synthetase (NDP forming)